MALLAGASVGAAKPDEDRASDAAERAERDAARAADRAERDATDAIERAERDAADVAERAARDETRYEEDRARILEETGTDAARQEEELAKLDADRAKDLAKEQEEAEKIAERLAEELAEVEEEAAEEAAEAEERAAKEAAERSEDEAEYGSSAQMQDLADSESPQYDDRGYPVRKGEIVGLDLSGETIATLQDQGFLVLARHQLPALGSTVFRLRAPADADATAALRQARDAAPGETFDYTHYYGMQYATSGVAEVGDSATLPRKKGRLTIGMIDTGLVSHPLMRGVAITRKSFGTSGNPAPPAHGTAVASILASEGTSRLFSANIFRGTATKPFTSADAIVDALDWMVAQRVPVVNMSLSGPRNAILDRLVKQSIGRGTLIVAAAGNGGPSAPPAYPAALPEVVAVTAVDSHNRVYRYANQGRYITVSAFGVGQPAADTKGGVKRFNGTSFATPHVAAWIARCLGKDNAQGCARRLRESARDLGQPGYDPVYGYGLIE
ncbi:S8 family serine peptidase [Parerythrobacter aestuarii]|uniref:S8 family serine peptidase n=1 Tax=Parerythrobacter aestuarii TaxID=3020909 RepID=UPI0024DE7C82|nr:S8 family serine peptidase [Parerythrobacter aestuarii]